MQTESHRAAQLVPPELCRVGINEELSEQFEENAEFAGMDRLIHHTLAFRRAAIKILSDLRDKRRDLWQAIPVTVITDTHRLISNLTERGFTAQQAEAVIDAIQDIDLSEMASKEDILRLEHKLEKLELGLTLKLGSLLSAGIAFLAFLRFFA